MAAYNGMSKRVKNALKALLAGIDYDTGSGNEDAFTSILGSTEGQFDGYPAVRVLPGDVTTEKADTGVNDRGLNYILRVHLPLEDTAEASEATYDHMYDLTDLMIDTLDRGDYTGALEDIEPDFGTWILNATRGDWYVTESEAGAVLMCDVNVEVKYSKDLV